MARPVRSGRILMLAMLALVGAPLPRSEAQFSGAGGFADSYTNPLSGMLVPRVPPQGEWAEVMTVTPKWLVIQNQNGQQFPISLAGVQLFLMRWPTSLEAIAPGALLEATGIDLSSNQIATDHVDVYEGTAHQLGVTPTIQTIIGFNRILTPFDIDQQNTFGIDFYRFLTPGEMNLPRRLHVVGPLANLNPLRIAIGGGNSIAVLPASGSFYMSSVTPGSVTFVKKGDLVYFVPLEVTPKSLNLAQLVVYKKIPFSQFSP